jgi:hypothetical protein
MFRITETGSINYNAPEVEVTVYEVLPSDHAEFLSSDGMNEVEETIIRETCEAWPSLIGA